MSQEQNQTAAATQEIERVQGTILPTVILFIGGLSAFVGFICIAYAIKNQEYWVLGYTLTCFLGAVMLFGFADIVQSLRVLARSALQRSP